MRKLDKAIIRDAILENLRKYGDLKHCCSGVNCSITTVLIARDSKSRYYNAEFTKAVDEALQYYARTNQHPKDNPECRQTILEQFLAQIKSGFSAVTEFGYHTDGVLLGKVKRKTYFRNGVEKWVFESVFPPPNPAQEGLLFFSANSASPAAQQDDATMAPDVLPCHWKAVQTLFQASVQKRDRKSELRSVPWRTNERASE